MTRKDTFDALKEWLKDVHMNAHENIPVFIIGNKQDLMDKVEVTPQMATTYADQIKAVSIQVSAKDGNGIDEIFLRMAKKLEGRKSH